MDGPAQRDPVDADGGHARRPGERDRRVEREEIVGGDGDDPTRADAAEIERVGDVGLRREARPDAVERGGSGAGGMDRAGERDAIEPGEARARRAGHDHERDVRGMLEGEVHQQVPPRHRASAHHPGVRLAREGLVVLRRHRPLAPAEGENRRAQVAGERVGVRSRRRPVRPV